ncbi:hypothetical protein NQ318_019797 [Aromia moschata]|uniref:Uncharacterized protein n=1 Tax=Aromia moschata TaxID=1265417 RepID=A0AAV8YML2_9CUCU|nr:hypothetical protein NQ318_019797 [Aromia moschata]
MYITILKKILKSRQQRMPCECRSSILLDCFVSNTPLILIRSTVPYNFYDVVKMIYDFDDAASVLALHSVREAPRLSLRRRAIETEISKSHLQRIFNQNLILPFKPKFRHTLEEGDEAKRLDFCLEMGNRVLNDHEDEEVPHMHLRTSKQEKKTKKKNKKMKKKTKTKKKRGVIWGVSIRFIKVT